MIYPLLALRSSLLASPRKSPPRLLVRGLLHHDILIPFFYCVGNRSQDEISLMIALRSPVSRSTPVWNIGKKKQWAASSLGVTAAKEDNEMTKPLTKALQNANSVHSLPEILLTFSTLGPWTMTLCLLSRPHYLTSSWCITILRTPCLTPSQNASFFIVLYHDGFLVDACFESRSLKKVSAHFEQRDKRLPVI